MFNETTSVPLIAQCCKWNSMGIIVNIGGKFCVLMLTRTVCVLTLTSGPVS
jgi:hypothetical protein